MQYHAIPCNTMQYNAIPCNTMQYDAILCNTMQYNAMPCYTMQYHASLINADGAYHCPVGSIMAFLLSLLLKSKVKRMLSSKLTSNLQKCQGVHIHIGCHFQSRHFFLSMYVVAWQSIVFDEMWNIRNSLLFPPQKDDNWQGQGKGAEAVRKFWRFTRQSCTTSRYRCIVW